MGHKRLGSQVDKIHRLEEEVARLNNEIAKFGPKEFAKTSCPYFGRCVVTDCDKLTIKCNKGEERNCIECADFLNDEKCDNWAWRNCTIMREAERLGANPWAEKHKKLSQVNIRQLREKVKVV